MTDIMTKLVFTLKKKQCTKKEERQRQIHNGKSKKYESKFDKSLCSNIN